MTLAQREHPEARAELRAGAEAATAYAELADDIADEDDLIWKVWTEDPETSVAGGVYLFADETSAARYVDKHSRRLASFGISGATITSLAVNKELSQITRAALDRG